MSGGKEYTVTDFTGEFGKVDLQEIGPSQFGVSYDRCNMILITPGGTFVIRGNDSILSIKYEVYDSDDPSIINSEYIDLRP